MSLDGQKVGSNNITLLASVSLLSSLVCEAYLASNPPGSTTWRTHELDPCTAAAAAAFAHGVVSHPSEQHPADMQSCCPA